MLNIILVANARVEGLATDIGISECDGIRPQSAHLTSCSW